MARSLASKSLKLPKQLKFVNDYLGGGEAAAGEEVVAAVAQASMVDAGQDVTLTWDTSRANTLTIEKVTADGTEFVASVENPGLQREFTFPAEKRERAVYVLTAHNWIERIPLIGETFGRAVQQTSLIVDPVKPEIELFQVSPTSIINGEPVSISWIVNKADEYALVVNGVSLPLDEARGAREEAPSSTTRYQMVARSPYWDGTVESQARTVLVSLPTPVIKSFSVDPRPIVDGDTVQISWEVEGATNVTILPIPGPVPNLQGLEEDMLEPGKSQQTFTLLAAVGEGQDLVQASSDTCC